MYLCGAGLVTTLRIIVASTGITFSLIEGSLTQTMDYSTMAIETFLPILVCLERGLASFGEMINIIVMNTLFGTGFAGLKYGMAT